MSQPEPEDEGRAAGQSGPFATFEEIIAHERASGWDPKAPDIDPPPQSQGPPRQPRRPKPPPAVPLPHRPATGPDPLEDEEHYIPPEPPPMPKMGMRTAFGLAVIALGMLILIVPDLLGLGYAARFPIGLLTLTLGLGWLIHHAVRRNRPDDGGDGTAL